MPQEALVMFTFKRDSEWEQIAKNSWKKFYPGNVIGLVIKVGRKKYVLNVAYQKNKHKFFITEDSSYYSDEFEAQDDCDQMVEELNNKL